MANKTIHMVSAEDVKNGFGATKSPKYNSILPYLKSKQVTVVKKSPLERLLDDVKAQNEAERGVE